MAGLMNKQYARNLGITAAILAAMSAPAHAENVIMAKLGAYSLNDERQVTSIEYTNETLTFGDPDNVVGIEYEWRFQNKWSVGGEYVQFKTDWRSNLFGRRGTVEAFTLTVRGKKYFAPTDWLLPYVGAGVGFAGGIFSSPFGESTLAGGAAQAAAGIEFLFGRVGLHTEAKVVSAAMEDDFGEEIDMSGTGYFAGLSVHF